MLLPGTKELPGLPDGVVSSVAGVLLVTGKRVGTCIMVPPPSSDEAH